jgi:hypothetical protein
MSTHRSLQIVSLQKLPTRHPGAPQPHTIDLLTTEWPLRFHPNTTPTATGPTQRSKPERVKIDHSGWGTDNLYCPGSSKLATPCDRDPRFGQEE